MAAPSPVRRSPALCLSLLCLACTHPAHYITPVPESDPRNFTWTIDTIAVPGSTSTLMKSIWGTSTHDIYTVGRSDLPGGTMFHYDGTSWRSVPLAASEGGTIQGDIALSQVLGLLATDVFACGGKTPSGSPPGTSAMSLVLHFDGKSWSEMQVPPGGMLSGIWGSSNDELWSAGVTGTLIHFLGQTWLAATFSDTSTFTGMAGVSANDVYALSFRSDTGVHDTTFRYLWHWNGGVWAIADSFPQVSGHADRFGTRAVWSLLAVTYTVGQGLFKQAGTAWDQILPPGAGGYFNAVYGRVNSALYVVGDAGCVIYMGPTSWYRFDGLTNPSINYYGAWTDGREVFIVGNDGMKTYILHGK